MFRIYKKLNYKWEPTSYTGDKKLIQRIFWKTLSRSKIYQFKIVEER